MQPKSEPEEIFPEGVKLRAFEDTEGLRNNIYDGVKEEFLGSFPKTHGGLRMEVADVDYSDKPKFSIQEQKDGMMKNKFLHRRLRGTLRLFDEKSGDLLDEKPNMTFMRVPFMSDRGTIIHNGNEYSIVNQGRLESGIYSRRKGNGDVEAQINPERGSGKGFRIRLEPTTGVLKLDIGQSSLHMYSLLRDIGHSDEDLKQRWGEDMFAVNAKKYDARVMNKAYDRLLGRRADPEATPQEKAQAIRDAIEGTQVRSSVLEKTLPQAFDE